MATPLIAPQTLFSFWSVVISIAICPANVVGKDAFLGASNPNAGKSDILQELETAIGCDHRKATERRVSRLEEAMRPTFNALPKDNSGRLDGTGVRYLLRRLFVQRHGWFVSGLESNGNLWNSSSPTDFVGTVAGVDAQGVFDKQLNTHGFDLHHAAVLAATLETFVHVESVERLQVAYDLVGLSPSDSNISEAEVKSVIEAYMLMYVLHKNHSIATREWFTAAHSLIRELYDNWDDTISFVGEIRQSVLEEDRQGTNAFSPLSWNTTLRIVETVGERYGLWQNRDCMDMKRKLVEMEQPNTGRVPLWRFYEHASVDPDWQFTETLETLQLMGMVDDSESSSMSVIIPNYINGPNNCLSGGKFYHVCCIDECDALMSHLEQHLVASEARPEQILKLVAALPSGTVTAPRTLPAVLSRRLRDIANHHGGRVPLHGRLFAQWMHHAYPRECSYPHLSGTIKSITSSEIMAMDVTITREQRDSLVDDFGKENRTLEIGDERVLPWTLEEELFVCRPGLPENSSQDEAARSAFVAKVVIAFFGVLLFAELHLRSARRLKAASVDALCHKGCKSCV